MRLWKDKSGPCMQVLHFTFAFGAFIAPLIAKNFISEDNSDITDDITTNYTHFSTVMPSTLGTETSLIHNYTSPYGDHSTRFKFAYWIVSATYLPTLIAFLYFAAKYDFLIAKHPQNTTVMEVACDEGSDMKTPVGVRYSKKDTDIELDVVTKRTNEEEPNGKRLSVSDDESASEKEEVIFVKNSSIQNKLSQNDIEKNILSTKAALLTRYRYTILLLLAAFVFVYVGMEVAYGSLIFTATVLGPLQFSKHQASLIQAVYWGLFTFGRLFSILLVVFKVRSSIMISMNLTGSLVASIIMIAFIHSAPAIWIASIILGASYSSIYPTAMTWMSENVEATGVASAILVAGGIFGNIILSALVGVSIAAVSPDMLYYLTFIGVVISGVIAGAMFWTAHITRRSDGQNSSVKSKTLQVSHSSSKEENVKLMEERDQSDDEEEHST